MNENLDLFLWVEEICFVLPFYYFVKNNMYAFLFTLKSNVFLWKEHVYMLVFLSMQSWDIFLVGFFVWGFVIFFFGWLVGWDFF